MLLKVFTTEIRSSQFFLDPIQKRAPAWSMQLEAVYLEALLYHFSTKKKENVIKQVFS